MLDQNKNINSIMQGSSDLEADFGINISFFILRWETNFISRDRPIFRQDKSRRSKNIIFSKLYS